MVWCVYMMVKINAKMRQVHNILTRFGNPIKPGSLIQAGSLDQLFCCKLRACIRSLRLTVYPCACVKHEPDVTLAVNCCSQKLKSHILSVTSAEGRSVQSNLFSRYNFIGISNFSQPVQQQSMFERRNM